MSTTPTRQDVVRATACPILHESHGRLTRTTYFVKITLRDGSEIRCEHTTEGHRTKEAAGKCARAMVSDFPMGDVS